jgi:predicted nucleotidyltransferase
MQNNKKEILNFLKILKPTLYSEGIVSLGLFGSIAKETNTSSSDLDIVYETSDIFIDKHKGWSALKDKIKNEALYV